MNRKLQVGDFVKDGYPNRSRHVPDRHGFIIEELAPQRAFNKVFKVLWTEAIGLNRNEDQQERLRTLSRHL